eukprot:2518984-Rhodomonas_salina.1
MPNTTEIAPHTPMSDGSTHCRVYSAADNIHWHIGSTSTDDTAGNDKTRGVGVSRWQVEGVVPREGARERQGRPACHGRSSHSGLRVTPGPRFECCKLRVRVLSRASERRVRGSDGSEVERGERWRGESESASGDFESSSLGKLAGKRRWDE